MSRSFDLTYHTRLRASVNKNGETGKKIKWVLCSQTYLKKLITKHRTSSQYLESIDVDGFIKLTKILGQDKS